jgi:hypothetical protein
VTNSDNNENAFRKKLRAQRSPGKPAAFRSRIFLSSRSLSKDIKTQRTIILPVVLYGCEALSLTLREEHRMRGFVTRVLRKIFGPMMEQVTM